MVPRALRLQLHQPHGWSGPEQHDEFIIRSQRHVGQYTHSRSSYVQRCIAHLIARKSALCASADIEICGVMWPETVARRRNDVTETSAMHTFSFTWAVTVSSCPTELVGLWYELVEGVCTHLVYFSRLLHPHPARSASSAVSKYQPPVSATIKLSTVGSRAFPVAAAQVWNGLPEAVVSSSSLQMDFPPSIENSSFSTFTPSPDFLTVWPSDWHRYSGPCNNVRYLGQSKNLCSLTYYQVSCIFCYEVHKPLQLALSVFRSLRFTF